MCRPITNDTGQDFPWVSVASTEVCRLGRRQTAETPFFGYHPPIFPVNPIQTSPLMVTNLFKKAEDRAPVLFTEPHGSDFTVKLVEHGVDPHTCLVDVLQRIDIHPQDRVAELTPRLWKDRFAETPLGSRID